MSPAELKLSWILSNLLGRSWALSTTYSWAHDPTPSLPKWLYIAYPGTVGHSTSSNVIVTHGSDCKWGGPILGSTMMRGRITYSVLRPHTQRKKENPRKSSYIHVPTFFWSLLYCTILIYFTRPLLYSIPYQLSYICIHIHLYKITVYRGEPSFWSILYH